LFDYISASRPRDTENEWELFDLHVVIKYVFWKIVFLPWMKKVVPMVPHPFSPKR
jgi:hypothetical protein